MPNSNNNSKNSANMDKLIGILAAKAGIPKEQLAADLAEGKLDSALNQMNPSQRNTFNQLINNPSLAKLFISNPQAQELYKKFVG
jgi:hypothetical protein